MMKLNIFLFTNGNNCGIIVIMKSLESILLNQSIMAGVGLSVTKSALLMSVINPRSPFKKVGELCAFSNQNTEIKGRANRSLSASGGSN
jgi:hypothetical protein